MKSYLFVLVAFLVVLTSCSPKITTTVMKIRPPVRSDMEVMVFDTPDHLSEKAEILGIVEVGDAGATTNCGYEAMMGLLKEEARKMGGNAVRILLYRPPDGFSSCHRFKAEVIYLPPGEENIVNRPGPDESEILVTEPVVTDPDLIVFTNGDSIYCKILKVKPIGITYSFQSNRGEISSTAPMMQVLTYSRNYNQMEIYESWPQDDFSEVRLNIYGGYSYMTAEIDESFSPFYQDYLKELKNGWSVGGDLCFFITRELGLGVKFNRFFSNNFYGNVYMQNGTTTVFGDLSNKIRTTFIGPIFAGRLILNNSGHTFHYSIGLGYLGYSNEGEMINQEFLQTGNTLGSTMDIGFDFAVREHILLGVKLSAISGKLSQIQEELNGRTTTYSLNADELVGLGSYDIAASLKFNF